tara:strand:+ start:6288 stop:7001 length:714 start_codon:yes stop_codon:yes gene_type:complete
MEDQIANLDHIKDFFLNSNVEVNITNYISAIIIAAILAFVVKKCYVYSSQSLSNKIYFSELFIPLAVITCLVITVIKFSLALSLGLVGALSIVRFRAAIKEPEELIYLFFIIGIGLATGANQFLVAIISTVFICLILVILANLRRKKLNYNDKVSSNVVQIEIKNSEIKIDKIILDLKKYCSHLDLKSTNISFNNELYTFWVEFKDSNSLTNLINSMKSISSNDIIVSFYSSSDIHE